MRWIQKHGNLMAGAAVLAACAVFAAVFIYLPDPCAQHLNSRSLPMNIPFSLGTDYLGRSLAARIFYGTLNSVKLISLTMLVTLIVAIPSGLVSARFRWVESLLDVISGALWSMPTFIIALIVFVGFKGQWIPLKFAILGIFNWVPIYRSVRDTTKQVQPSSYVFFARAMGMGESRIYLFNILPNVFPGVFPIILLSIVSLFEAEFFLSFLGMSYPDPAPTLGGILRQGINYMNLDMVILPSSFLAFIVISIIILYQKSIISERKVG